MAGFPPSRAAESNAQSTAFAVQGLLAAGVDPGSLHRRGAFSPLGYLSSLIALRWSRALLAPADQTPVWVTAQALMALRRSRSRSLRWRSLIARRGPGRGPAGQRQARPRRIRRGRERTGSRGALRRAVRAALPTAAARSLARLAADAGLLSALAFAPVGLS